MKTQLTFGRNILFVSMIIFMSFSFSSCVGLRMHNPKVTGTPSSEVWFPENKYDVEEIPSLIVQTGKEYRILILADTQLDGAPGHVHKTMKLIDHLVDSVKPDFIITLGDNVEWLISDKMTKKLIKKYHSFKIPYAVTLGNHDSEGRKGRPWYGNAWENAPNSLFRYGPSNIHGVGNYSVLLKDVNGNIIYDLIMMDSNVWRNYPDGTGFDFIYRDQIDWYKWNIEGVSKAEYGDYDPSSGKVVPSMCFFHIPLPEYQEAVDAIKEGKIDPADVVGETREGVACPKINTGFFDVMKKMKSTTHVFVGHDHVNNLSVKWKGIQLSYGLKSGYTSYHSDDMIGGVVLTLKNKTEGKVDVNIKYIYVDKKKL